MTEIATSAKLLVTASADASRDGIWRRPRSDSAGHRHPTDCAASYDAPEAQRCAHKVGSATRRDRAPAGTTFDRILGRGVVAGVLGEVGSRSLSHLLQELLLLGTRKKFKDPAQRD